MRPVPSPNPSRLPRVRRRVVLLVIALTLGAVAVLRLTFFRSGPGSRPARPAATPTIPSGAALDPDLVRQFIDLESAEREVDRTTWAPERRAQARAAWVESLWDSLNSSPDALATLAAVPFRSIARAPSAPDEVLPHGIRRQRSAPGGPPAPWPDWRETLEAGRARGWQLTGSEWRHVRFQPAATGNPDISWFEVRLDLTRTAPAPAAQSRAQGHGRVRFDWTGEPGTGEPPGKATIEAWAWLDRVGDLPFHQASIREIAPFPRTSWIDPLIVADLDRDGSPEILLAARNLVLRRQPDATWREDVLAARHPGLIFTAVLADFTGDPWPDLLCAVRSGLVLLRGQSDGRFASPAETAWAAPERLQYAQALTCGDIDEDGDLDVFLGQYRTPYEGGQMPRPYFDALDGPPAYLLRNNGTGRFADATAGSGLEPRRHRRTYGASFADLDSDGDLDLVVTSDFAGMEAHANDGTGHFTDASARWIPGARGFGMSHTFSDFNADGRLDLLMVAMPQPTADRLNALGLERPGFEAWHQERLRMVKGNRLFLGTDGGFSGPGPNPTPDSDQDPDPALARTGWAWSAAAVDLDHDRYPELHVVNGHETRQSVRDYESEFWTQDIYLPASTPAPVADAYFAAKFAATRARGWSYGGHDRNRLLLNLGGRDFMEVGHLFGLALAEDSRNVLGDDLDGDGDIDLLVTTFEIWPRVRQTLRIFENRLPNQGHWIGFRLPEGQPHPNAIGAVVRLQDASGSQVRTVTTGDGYRSQGDALVRFGLGTVSQVNSMEIRYPGGRTLRWPAPFQVDTVHRLPSP